ncbi:MAG: NAD(P)H-hydrate dehydratase, partial [Hyphomonadaceae bacterium]|nr:NAD(P)H-hydrate dehydratase [Hyphomonadaceae bacterium]
VGEFRRAFPGIWGAAANRIDAARAAAAYARCVVLLKGPDTVIAAPDGRAIVNTSGTPFLATAGSGDVLGGFIAGLIAQGMVSFEAAAAAAWLHGKCGEALGPGLIAEDICEKLPLIFNGLVAATAGRSPDG